MRTKVLRTKGLTLLEVILVMVILAIVAGVFYTKTLNKGTQLAKVNSLSGVVENVMEAIGQFTAANGCFDRLANCGGLFTDTTTDFAPDLVTKGFLAGLKTPLDPNGIKIYLNSSNDRVANIVLETNDTTLAQQAVNLLRSVYDTANNLFVCDAGGGTTVTVLFVPPTIPPVALNASLCP